MSAKADASAVSTAAPASGASSAKKGGGGGIIPLVIALVAAPAATWATVEFVLLPRLKAQLSSPVVAGDGAHAEAAHAEPAKESGGHGGGGEKGGASTAYEFSNVVVNLAGTMGTRYLKCSFLVIGTNPNIKSLFEENKPRLMDVTLNVMSALTLADLEEPGSKNIIREKLVTAYNTALGKKVADQVYFSDFVVQ